MKMEEKWGRISGIWTGRKHPCCPGCGRGVVPLRALDEASFCFACGIRFEEVA